MIDYFDNTTDSAINDAMLSNDYHITSDIDHNEIQCDEVANKCEQILF